MNEGPVVDGRAREELLAHLQSVADTYTDDWNPDSEDVGTTMFRIFARFHADIVQRLDEMPEKHRLAFLDALDFGRRPPQTARVPLTFRTVEGIDENVVVPGGTQATAETEESEQIFEIPTDGGFEATSSTLQDVYSVDPVTDRIFDHTDEVLTGEETTLFTGEDLQEHVLYLGDTDLLNLQAGSSISVTMVTNADAETLEENLAWEYYGENEDGEVDWHSLPKRMTDVVESYSELDDTTLQDLTDAVRRRIRELYAGEGAGWRDNSFELSFSVPGTIAEHAIDGVESRWIRARIVEDDPANFDVEIEAVSLKIDRNDADSGTIPGRTLSNDVPLTLDGEDDAYMFGRQPRPPSTLYMASEETFTKNGARVHIEFAEPEGEDEEEEEEEGEDEEEEDDDDDESRIVSPPATGAMAGPPDVSWEYWNGDGWTQLEIAADETNNFQEKGVVSFEVPDDLDLTSVAGHENYWIRARLVEGNYGQPSYRVSQSGNQETVDGPDPPLYSTIEIRYTQAAEQFTHVVSLNNAAYSHDRIGEDAPTTAFAPFERVPDDSQTLYMGFDASLHNGPINFHVPVGETTYPRTFDPGMRWEYCTIAGRHSWSRLEVKDGTEGLTERGIAVVNFPEESAPLELFDRERHWVRVRVTGDQFDDSPDGAAAADGGRVGEIRGSDASDRSRTHGTKSPPKVRGIYPNTQWAYNRQTVDDEILGSSDGTHGQSFSCDNEPVTEIEVWVDEVSALSRKEQRELEAADEWEVDRVPETGVPVEFWVKWSEIGDFLDSGERSRHYRIDQTTGTVTFGDGERGMIPPSGTNNVRATYKTGGGSDGNIGVGTIEDLRDPISLVDDVVNLRPSDGGADVESMNDVASRAPQQIKNRGKAVTPRDFEQVAMAESRDLAKAKCEPELDAAGNRTPGWVTLLIVPRERRERPKPTLELRQRVRESVSERAPATLVGRERQRIVVRGPNYARVSVDVTVTTPGVESVTSLKSAIESDLGEFLHPLTGGADGEGWEFGQAPRLSQLTTLIEAVEGVHGIEDVMMTVATGSERIKIRVEQSIPELDRDTMISNGTHDVEVSMIEER